MLVLFRKSVSIDGQPLKQPQGAAILLSAILVQLRLPISANSFAQGASSLQG